MYLVDAHHHFQDMQRHSYPWLESDRPLGLEGDLSAIRRDFLPHDYRIAAPNVTKTVHVQNGWVQSDPVGETLWLASLGQDAPTAIVAYADLSQPDLKQILAAHRQSPQMRGIRQILNWHKNPKLRVAAEPNLMEQDAWRRGYAELAAQGLSFDLQLYWPQMAMARELAADFPDTPMILNHFGMPIDRSFEGIAAWRAAMRQLSACPNVMVKLSGFGLGQPHWTLAGTVPLLDYVIRLFTPDRVMFGTNLPVDLLFAPAECLFAVLEAVLAPLGPDDQAKVRHRTAERAYRI